jgi:release factor glutamine methyltransferase
MGSAAERERLIASLASGGVIAPQEEADLLLSSAGREPGSLDRLLSRRLAGEPLAWIVGWTSFCGLSIHVDPGVFVPRPHSEALARRAVALLPPDGVAVDLCTGSGAIAAVLAHAHPAATVVATDVDPVAVACARTNGVHTLLGDLDEPLPETIRGGVDVLTAVVPYVPTEELHLLPRDVLAHESPLALDGGPRGTRALRRAVQVAARWLRPGGTVLLEIGGDQAEELTAALIDAGFSDVAVIDDGDGQDRAIEAVRAGQPRERDGSAP